MGFSIRFDDLRLRQTIGILLEPFNDGSRNNGQQTIFAETSDSNGD